MDKEVIERAAKEAVQALQLDCDVTEITKPLGKDVWCLQFTCGYGQFCDSFHDKAGEENSARVIREKIKRFFLKQRKPTRIVRGRPASATTRRTPESNLLSTLLEAGEGVLKEATRITGEVIDRAANLNRTVLETEADWVETISPTAAEIIRPEGTSKSGPGVVPPQRIVEPVSAQPLESVPQARTAKKKAAGKVGRAATKKSKARTSQKSSPPTSKKAAAKSASAKKSGTKRKGAKSGKKTSGKKSGSKKSRKAIKLFY